MTSMITTYGGLASESSLDANWNRLVDLTTSLLVSGNGTSRDAAIASDELSRYSLLLQDLRHDRNYKGIHLLGMYNAPASKNRHHNVKGGLVKHLLQMWEIWIHFQRLLREHNAYHPALTDLNVWKCILHHDLNKVWKYKLVSETPWQVDYANIDDRSEYILGPTNKAIYLLGKHGITLNILFLNALITSEGGFSQGPRPKTETALSKLAYLLDEMSANVIDRIHTNRFWDSKEGGYSDFS